VNAPLQDRAIVLDLDTNRANAFPTDYDTDLEYVWSDLSNRSSFFYYLYSLSLPSAIDLFADGDDFSQETIDKNRNIYYQKQLVSFILYLLFFFL
jgi:hypothetical protein